MSINTEGNGRQLAIVKDGDKKHKKLIFSISEDKKHDNNNYFQEYTLENGTFQYITDSKKNVIRFSFVVKLVVEKAIGFHNT